MRNALSLSIVAITVLIAFTGNAVETEIENDVPVSAEATTAIVPGKEADIAPAAGQPGVVAAPKPDRIYTDGMLANPEPKAEDLGMASPGQKMKIDVDHPESQADAAK